MANLANYTDQFTQEEFYHKSRENGWVVKGDRNFLNALYLAASKNKEMYALAQIISSKNIWHVDDRKDFIPFVVKTVHDAIFSDISLADDSPELLIATANLKPLALQESLESQYKEIFGMSWREADGNRHMEETPEEEYRKYLEESREQDPDPNAPAMENDPQNKAPQTKAPQTKGPQNKEPQTKDPQNIRSKEQQPKAPQTTEPKKKKQKRKPDADIYDPDNRYLKQVEKYEEMIHSVDYNMLHLGSQEFRDMKTKVAQLKVFAERNMSGEYVRTPDLAKYMDLHATALAAVKHYLDHKLDDFHEEPRRRNSPKHQKREQPRIVIATTLLSEMRRFQILGLGAFLQVKKQTVMKALEQRLADEDELRSKEEVSKGIFTRSIARSIELISNLNGADWEARNAETCEMLNKRLDGYLRNARELAKNFEEEKNGKWQFHDTCDDFIRNGKNNTNRAHVKRIHEQFKDVPDAERHYTNAQLTSYLLQNKYGNARPYITFDEMNADRVRRGTELMKEDGIYQERLYSEQTKRNPESIQTHLRK